MSFLWRVDSGQSYLVLHALSIQHRERVAVRDSNDPTLDRLRMRSDGERDRYNRQQQARDGKRNAGSLKAYVQLADQLVEHATKEQLADCARILALNVAHYASRYGELPIEEHLDFLHVESLSDEQAKFVRQGMETFIGVLGNMLGQEPPMH